MNTEQYLLSFDFAEITREISGLQSAYTALTTEIKRSSDEADQSFSKVANRIETLSGSLARSAQTLNVFYNDLHARFKDIASSFKSISKASDNIVNNLSKLGGLDLSNLAQRKQKDISERLSAAVSGGDLNVNLGVSEAGDLSTGAINKAQRALGAAKKAIEETNKADTLWGKTLERGKKLAVGEAGSAFSAMRGLLGKGAGSVGMGGALGGGVVGLLGLILLGIHDEQRVSAERGEMLNAVEAAGGLYEEKVQKGVDWLAAFGEHAQFQFGISRKEIQKVAAQVANLGIKLDTTLTGTSTNFEDVRNNVVTTNLALDKYFGLAAGTNMSQSLELMQRYGYTLDTATSSIERLRFASQAAGMDMEKFVNSVMAGSAALVQYQIDTDDVSQVLLTIQRRYEEVGISSQRAGSMAADVTQGIAQSFSNMGMSKEMLISQKMFPEIKDPYESRLKLKEMFLQKGPDQDLNMLHRFASIVKEQITSMGIKGRGRGITALQEIFGMDFQQAHAIYEYIGDLPLDKTKETTSPEALKEFRDTFTREGQTLTDLFKAQKSVMKALASVGKGMLKVLVGILGTLGIWVKSMPGLFDALGKAIKGDLKGAGDIIDQIDAAYQVQFDLIGKSVADFKEAGKHGRLALDHLGATFSDIADTFEAVNKFDPGGHYKELGNKIEGLDLQVRTIDAKLSKEYYAFKQDVLAWLGDKEGAAQAGQDKIRNRDRESRLVTEKHLQSKASKAEDLQSTTVEPEVIDFMKLEQIKVKGSTLSVMRGGA